MFDSLLIRPHRQVEDTLDLGMLAEAMIFYGDVTVLARENVIGQLVRECTPDILLELLSSRHFKLAYEFEMAGIRTVNAALRSQSRHSAVLFSSPNHELQHLAPRLFRDATGKSGLGRRMASRFMPMVQVVKRPAGALAAFNSDLTDSAYLKSVVRAVVDELAPGFALPSPLVFEVSHESEEFTVTTNIDFNELNRAHKVFNPSADSSITEASLLTHALTCRDNLYFAAAYKCDISANSLQSLILAQRVAGILTRHRNYQTQIEQFQSFVFDGGRAIRESINSGAASFKDLLPILERASEFRKWLSGQPANADLVKEYFRAVVRESWVDRLPAKSSRWAIFTGAGMVLDGLGAGGLGTATGLGISAADTFVLDLILKGWRPNQFVDGPLKSLIGGRKRSWIHRTWRWLRQRIGAGR